MKLLKKLEKSREFWFLLITSFIFFILRLPSLFEPYWYGDEGIYQTVGIAMRQGRLLYKGIWDNKPPLLYTLYAIFNSDQFSLRLVSLIFGLLSIIIFYKLAKKLFSESDNKKILNPVFIATFLYSILFAIPLLEGNIANAENFMALPILLAAFIIFETEKTKKQALFLGVSGFLLATAFLFKIVAVFDTAAFFLFLLFIETKEKKSLQKLINFFVPFITGFIIPIFLTSFYFIVNNAFIDFIKASFVQNVGYVGYGNRFIIPQGLLILKLIILGIFTLTFFIYRKKLSKTNLFILLWLAFSIFNALFSQRPYTHYVLVLLPSFSLLVGLIFFEKKLKKLAIIIFIILFFILSVNFNFYGKTLNYYQNFIAFILNKKDISDYRTFFDKQTPKDYQLAEFIRTNTNSNDNIFIWGNDAQVYKLANKLPPGRYTVAYHITTSKATINETMQAFYKVKPKFVAVISPGNTLPFPLTGYIRKFNINQITIYEKIL